MRTALLLIAWLAAAPALSAASGELEARLWAADLGGVARAGNGEGTTIDLVSDLGFGDAEALEGRLIWRPTRRTSIRLAYAGVEFDGNALLDRTLSFAGTTFRLDAEVTSMVELELGSLGLAWQPLSNRDGSLRLGPLIEAHGLRATASIATTLLGLAPLSAREEVEAGIAAAGLVLDIEPSRRFHVYAEWTTSVQGDEADLTDFEVGLHYRPFAALALSIGYRRLELGASDADELVDLELDGPFLGAVLNF